MAKHTSTNNGKLEKNEYYEQLASLQVELNDLTRWLLHSKRRLAIVIEGRDTAGKGQ